MHRHQPAPLAIDSHCHFDFADFDPDRQSLWQQCQQYLQALIIPGVSPQQWKQAAHLCQYLSQSAANTRAYHAVGLHPWWIEEYRLDHNLSDLPLQLSQAIDQTNPIAIGESGLDKLHQQYSDLETQQHSLQYHLQAAVDHSLPLILHSVKTHALLLQQLKRYHLPKGGVIHAFSGSYEQGLAFWKQGFYLGIGGTITYERAQKTRDAVKRLPLEALLLETDAPDMPLSGHQGERNTPLSANTVATTLAHLRQQPTDDIIRQTTDNTNALFELHCSPS